MPVQTTIIEDTPERTVALEVVTDVGGDVIATRRKVTDKQGSPADNEFTLRSRAAQALTANDAYVALPLAQRQAQADAQLVRVTKECSALIRLLLGQFDTTSGT